MPIGRQRKDRQGWKVDRINGKRNLGSKRTEVSREEEGENPGGETWNRKTVSCQSARHREAVEVRYTEVR